MVKHVRRSGEQTPRKQPKRAEAASQQGGGVGAKKGMVAKGKKTTSSSSARSTQQVSSEADGRRRSISTMNPVPGRPISPTDTFDSRHYVFGRQGGERLQKTPLGRHWERRGEESGGQRGERGQQAVLPPTPISGRQRTEEERQVEVTSTSTRKRRRTEEALREEVVSPPARGHHPGEGDVSFSEHEEDVGFGTGGMDISAEYGEYESGGIGPEEGVELGDEERFRERGHVVEDTGDDLSRRSEESEELGASPKPSSASSSRSKRRRRSDRTVGDLSLRASTEYAAPVERMGPRRLVNILHTVLGRELNDDQVNQIHAILVGSQMDANALNDVLKTILNEIDLVLRASIWRVQIPLVTDFTFKFGDHSVRESALIEFLSAILNNSQRTKWNEDNKKKAATIIEKISVKLVDQTVDLYVLLIDSLEMARYVKLSGVHNASHVSAAVRDKIKQKLNQYLPEGEKVK